MNLHAREQLIQALRSGEFLKRKTLLRSRDAQGNLLHSTLGILCELYRRETGLGAWVYEAHFEADAWTHDTESCSTGRKLFTVPSRHVYAWAGIDNHDFRNIDNMNDTLDLSFEQIAEQLSCVQTTAPFIEMVLVLDQHAALDVLYAKTQAAAKAVTDGHDNTVSGQEMK
jgi:hypothetical protein